MVIGKSSLFPPLLFMFMEMVEWGASMEENSIEIRKLRHDTIEVRIGKETYILNIWDVLEKLEKLNQIEEIIKEIGGIA